jgi:post-segregation antitoxin (ccd killing protein)
MSIIKNISIKEKHEEWLRKKGISLSKFVQNAIDKEIEKEEQENKQTIQKEEQIDYLNSTSVIQSPTIIEQFMEYFKHLPNGWGWLLNVIIKREQNPTLTKEEFAKMFTKPSGEFFDIADLDEIVDNAEPVTILVDNKPTTYSVAKGSEDGKIEPIILKDSFTLTEFGKQIFEKIKSEYKI